VRVTFATRAVARSTRGSRRQASCWHQPCDEVRISVFTSPIFPSAVSPTPSEREYRPAPCAMNASASSSAKKLRKSTIGGSCESISGPSAAKSSTIRSNVRGISPGSSAGVRAAGAGQR